MKFKILKGTKLFDKLTAVHEEMIRCNKEALELVHGLGYKTMRGKAHVLAGGISSILIPGEKPAGWKNAYPDVKGEYFPSLLNANKELLAKIEALPVVEYDAINKPLKFDWSDRTTSRRVSFHPGIMWRDNYILVDVPENYINYRPVKDMIEILESKFKQLSNK